MPDTWGDIHGPEGPRAQGFSGQRGPRHDTPLVRRPTCAEHCSGSHARESDLYCAHCARTVYEVWTHEWAWTSGHYFYEFRPVGDAPVVPPGTSVPPCAECGRGLSRR